MTLVLDYALIQNRLIYFPYLISFCWDFSLVADGLNNRQYHVCWFWHQSDFRKFHLWAQYYRDYFFVMKLLLSLLRNELSDIKTRMEIIVKLS